MTPSKTVGPCAQIGSERLELHKPVYLRLHLGLIAFAATLVGVQARFLDTAAMHASEHPDHASPLRTSSIAKDTSMIVHR